MLAYFSSEGDRKGRSKCSDEEAREQHGEEDLSREQVGAHGLRLWVSQFAFDLLKYLLRGRVRGLNTGMLYRCGVQICRLQGWRSDGACDGPLGCCILYGLSIM